MYDAIGKTYGLWSVKDKSCYRAKNGKLLYECVCNKCGNTSYMTLSNIKRSRGRNCSKCTPNYQFKIVDDIAIGVLPNGVTFRIDAEDVEKVSQYRWFYNKDSGYITSSTVDKSQTFLHRFILGLKHDDKVVVDHKDRKKRNCTKENLRIVTIAQNTYNKTLRRTSKTGFSGVSFVKQCGLYKASIQINHNNIVLGMSSNPIECAQMYNVASSILFGEYSGQKNTVPVPSEELVELVRLKCMPYITISKRLTQPIAYEAERRQA